jgi:hypothetical protein
MKSVLAIAAALLFAQSETTMILPKVEHHERTETHVEKHDDVTRSCPDGYEGHLVDIPVGFDGYFNGTGISINGWEQGTQMFTVCFKIEFMEKLRKNPDMTVYKGVIHGV